MTTDIARIGLEVDSTKVVEGKNRLDQLGEAGKKTETAIDSFKRNWLSMTGAIASGMAVYDLAVNTILKVYHAVENMVLAAARYNSMGVVMERVGKQAGYSADQMHQFQKQLEAGGIAMTEARETLSRMAMAHIDLSKASQLSRLAQDAAVIANTNSSEAFARVVYGIQTAQPEILRTLGITVNFSQEYQRLSVVLNKNVKDLTETEKMQARLNAVLEKGKDIAGVYTDAMDTAGKQLTSLKRFQDNLAVSMGQVFQDTLLVAVRGYTDYLKDAISTTQALSDEGAIKEWGRDVAMIFAVAMDVVNDFVQGLRSVGIVVLGVGAAWMGWIEILKGNFSEGKAQMSGALDFMTSSLRKVNDSFGTYTANAEKLFKEVDDRAKKRKDDQLKHDQEYAEKSIKVLQAYANHSVEIQRAAQKALRDSFYPGSADPEAPLKKPDTGLADKQKEAVEGLRRQILLQKDASNVEKTLFEIRFGNYTKFSEQTKKEIMLLAEVVDMREREIEVLKRVAELAKAAAEEKTADANVRNDILNYMEDYEKKLDREYELLGKTKAQKALLNAEWELEKNFREKVASLSENYSEAEYQHLVREYEMKRKIILLKVKENGEREEYFDKEKKASEEYNKNWLDIFKNIDSAAQNAFVNIFEGGRDVFKRLADTIKTTVLAALYQMVVRPWVIQIVGSMTGQTGIANQMLGLVGGGGGGGGGFGFGNILSGANTVGNLLSGGGMISGGFNALAGMGSVGTMIGQSSVGQFIGGLSGAISGPGLQGAAAAGSQLAGSLSSVAGALGIFALAVAAAIASMRFYGQGWNQAGMPDMTDPRGGLHSFVSGTTYRSLTALGISDKWANIMSGAPIVARLWGHRERQNDAQGIAGAITPDSFTGRNWTDWSRQGGTFRSDIRGQDTNPLTDSQKDFFDGFMRAVSSVTEKLAESLGLNIEEALAGYVKEFSFQLNENGEPLSDEKIAEIFNGLFTDVMKEQVQALFRAGGEDEIAEYIGKLKGTTEEIKQQVIEVVMAFDGLKKLNLKGLDFGALKDWMRDGETIGQTFERVAGQWNFFQQSFLTDAQKLELAQGTVNAAFQKMGIAVPKSKDEFFQLVKGLDLSTEAGRKLWDALAEVAPAFIAVSDASSQAAAALKQNWESVISMIDQLNGNSNRTRATLTGRLNDSVAQFQANNAWAQGMSPEQLVAAFKTITEEDFAAYSEENRALIMAILGLALNIQGLNESVQAVGPRINPAYEIPQEDVISKWMSQTDTIINAVTGEGSYDERFTRRNDILLEQEEKARRRMAELEEQFKGYQMPPEWKALFELVNGRRYDGGPTDVTSFAKQREQNAADMARFTILKAQYGENAAESLFDLEKWYEQQKEIVKENHAALTALEEIYGKRRTEIIEGSIEETQRLKESLKGWLQDLITGPASPVAPLERMRILQEEYKKAFEGGDIEKFKAISEQMIGLGEQLWSRSGPEFLNMFDKIIKDGQLLGGFTLENYSPVSSQHIVDMRDAVVLKLESVERVNEELRQEMSRMRQEQEAQALSLEEKLEGVGEQIARDVGNAVAGVR